MEDLRNNNNQPIRINNPDLISEFDTSNKQNALPEIQQDCYINNLVGGSNRDTKPNYCLHFDKTNPNVRISFPLKSADKDKYRFVIKGEGSHEVLFVDYSGVYISITPKPYMFNNWPTAYFDLSYIAILDNDKSSATYGKMLHLFNCEEGAGTILYDSIGEEGHVLVDNQRSDYRISAQLCRFANIKTLRATSASKEWINNPEKNFENWFDASATGLVIEDFSSKNPKLTLPLSICFTYDIDSWNELPHSTTLEFFNFQTASLILNLCFEVADNKTWFGYHGWLSFKYKDIQYGYDIENGDVSKIFPAGKHYVSITLNRTSDNKLDAKIFVDNKQIDSSILKHTHPNILPDDINLTEDSGDLYFGTITDIDGIHASATSLNEAPVPIKLARLAMVNFDMSASDSVYTPGDYMNYKEPPLRFFKYTGWNFTDNNIRTFDNDIAVSYSHYNEHSVYGNSHCKFECKETIKFGSIKPSSGYRDFAWYILANSSNDVYCSRYMPNSKYWIYNQDTNNLIRNGSISGSTYSIADVAYTEKDEDIIPNRIFKFEGILNCPAPSTPFIATHNQLGAGTSYEVTNFKVDEAIFYIDNISSTTALDKTFRAYTIKPAATNKTFVLSGKCYGTFLNNAGYGLVLSRTLSFDLGTTVSWVDDNNVNQVGWTGAKKTRSNGQTQQFGGRGIPSDGSTSPVGLSFTNQFIKNSNQLTVADNDSEKFNNANKYQTYSGTSLLCLENHKWTESVKSRPIELFHLGTWQAIDLYTYKSESLWATLRFFNNDGIASNTFNTYIKNLGYPFENNRNSRYRYNVSIWIRRFENHPFEQSNPEEYKQMKVGIAGIEAAGFIDLYTIPTTWTKYEFTTPVRTNAIDYYWQWDPAIAAGFPIPVSSDIEHKMLTCDPVVAVGVCRVELVQLQNPIDRTEFKIPENMAFCYCPRPIISQ